MEKDILEVYRILYNDGLYIKEKSYKSISKEDISNLIIKCVFLKNNIEYFFKTFSEKNIEKAEKKYKINILNDLLDLQERIISCLNEFSQDIDSNVFEMIREPAILNTKDSKLNNLSKDFYNLMLKTYQRKIFIETNSINAQQSQILLEEMKAHAKGIKINYNEELLSKYYEETNWNILDMLNDIIESKSSLQEFEEKTNNVVKYIAIYLVIVAVIMLFIAFSQD
ncbi:MAG TPA: hypothetical protein IAB56_00810 [Candidatus Scybalousia intestinigallinarum]|nr:hypothetical protein [Candidatus Scybalousia intestinigallinarum]